MNNRIENCNNIYRKQSFTFKVLKKIGIIGDIQKYGQITFGQLINLCFKTVWKRILFNYAYKNLLFEPINKKNIRPLIWRKLGCKVGQNVMIGHAVRLDFGNAELIEIGDNVVISNNTTLLCHKRDISNYRQGNMAVNLPFKYERILLGDGCQIGINSTILPGVTIGKGVIIGSCSVVTKDIPDWSIAVGVPAKIIKKLEV